MKRLITKREALLLTLVIICLEIFVFVNIILIPLSNKNSEYKDWIERNESAIINLEREHAAINSLRDKINQIQSSREELAVELPSHNIQEEIIDVINEAADDNFFEITEIEFSNYYDFSVDEFLAYIPGGRLYESNVIPSIGASLSFPRVLYQSLYINFVADYEDFYRFLQAIENNKRIYPVSEVSIARVDDIRIAGRIKILNIGYVSDGNNYIYAQVPPKPIVTRNNPFLAY